MLTEQYETDESEEEEERERDGGEREREEIEKRKRTQRRQDLMTFDILVIKMRPPPPGSNVTVPCRDCI